MDNESMNDDEKNRLDDAELKAFFDRLFPNGFAGEDVLAELAPTGWEKSPLMACFHPSVEQVYQERVQIHRNLERLVEGRRAGESDEAEAAPKAEPTLEEVKADWKESPVNVVEEVTELMGKCLWDVFSDNHEVVAADGRRADLGSFRSAGSFLHEYLTGEAGMPSIEEMLKLKSFEDLEASIGEMGYMRFYMGTVWLRDRADLTPVYEMIFRRLKALGADWVYHFPELGIVDLSGLAGEDEDEPGEYSPSEAFGKEQEEKERQEELEKLRADLAESHQEARQEALDRPPPATVQAYQAVYGRDPKGWPPA